VAEGAVLRVDDPKLGALAVTRINGQVHAVADACPHAVASLSDGFVADGHIVCPVHFAEFDLVDGAPRNAPAGCGKLTICAVSETGDKILIHDRET
jgi:nitrite reductase/ring-hydroxylating ferredoxin subunit